MQAKYLSKMALDQEDEKKKHKNEAAGPKRDRGLSVFQNPVDNTIIHFKPNTGPKRADERTPAAIGSPASPMRAERLFGSSAVNSQI
jgi:hypothetical protein